MEILGADKRPIEQIEPVREVSRDELSPRQLGADYRLQEDESVLAHACRYFFGVFRDSGSGPLPLLLHDSAADLFLLAYREIVVRFKGEIPDDDRRRLLGSMQLEALERVAADRPDVILLDVLMPDMDGYEVCRRLRADPSTQMLPVVMITASGSEEKIKAIEAGADDFVTKPFNQPELLARIGSLLRIKEYHDTIQAQAQELAEWNRTLEERVRQQVAELERIGRLRRFLAPQVAELIVDSGDETFLESHRREITVVFCDLRGFTAFSEAAEPEEVMRVLREYHEAMGKIIFRYEGTLERFAGDGLMVFFNDPLPCIDAPRRAVQMAIAMRERVRELGVGWRKHGYRLGFGAGVALGYATLGKIGFEGRFDYAAIGNATNLASRLCDEAGDGQVLISQRVYSGVEDVVDVEPLGEMSLRGFVRSTPVYNVLGLKRSASRPGSLTAREVEVALLIAEGLSNRDIAERLVITEGTAANHVEHILNKLGFNSRAQIAAWTADHLLKRASAVGGQGSDGQ